MRLSKHKNIVVISVDPWALNTPIWDNAANHTGHAPRMGMMELTSKAVNAVMYTAANIVHKHQIKHSPSAAHAVETDVKERMKKERKLSKQKQE